jgi:hypothetical protein
MLTFGVLSPVVMVPAILAFFLEVLTYGYFIRRFLIICTRLREMNKETKYEENKGNVVLPQMYIKAKEVLSFDLDPETRRKDVVTCRYEGDYEIYLDSDKNIINLSELELIVEQECADKNFEILRPIVFLLTCSCFFLGCVAWDMSATKYGAWLDTIFFMCISFIVPSIGVLYLRYHRKYDILRFMNERTKLDLSNNPIHDEELNQNYITETNDNNNNNFLNQTNGEENFGKNDVLFQKSGQEIQIEMKEIRNNHSNDSNTNVISSNDENKQFIGLS